VAAQRDPAFRHALNHCGMATEAGMPLVWWSRLAGFSEAGRVSGSDLLDEVCAFGVPHKFRHYFYGASRRVVEQLIDRLQKRHPGLCVVGYRSPPLRPSTPAEGAADIAAINAAEPDFVWVGLGMPKQEKWMVDHLGKIKATALIGVGAAFDFHAGTKPRAPVWMRHAGLEWLFRLLTEPRRFAHRYLIDNLLFIGHTLQQMAGSRKYSLDVTTNI
jgi:N-acetylglucosaminyldiphosphoundecaprenol N-acetyl-beta-D-mannosaminyltransferase